MSTQTALAAMLSFACMVLASCASLPKAEVYYYLAQTEVRFKVVRTVACDGANIPVIATSVAPVVIHSADLSASAKQTIDLSKLKAGLADTDVKIEFYEDRRLKAFNATFTGQGEAILKSVVTVAAAALGFKSNATPFPVECAEIKKAGNDKPLTLIYEGTVDLSAGQLSKEQSLKPDTTSSFYAAKFAKVVGHVCAIHETHTAPSKPIDKLGDEYKLALREPGMTPFKVTAGGNNSCQDDTVYDDLLPVAQHGTLYDIPIPKPASFGKQSLALTVSESGALTSLQYVSNTGTGQALNVLQTAMTATADPTTEQKVAAIKAQADLIFQQQRLVACLADPPNCK